MMGRYYASVDDVIAHMEVEIEQARASAQRKSALMESGGARLRDAGGKNAVARERVEAVSKAYTFQTAIEMLKDIHPLESHQLNKVELPDTLCPLCGGELPGPIQYPEPYKPWLVTFSDGGFTRFLTSEEAIEWIADRPNEKFSLEYVPEDPTEAESFTGTITPLEAPTEQ